MKFCNISLLLFVTVALACILSISSAQEETSAGKRLAPRRPVGKSAKTSTTSQPPAHDGEDEGDYGDEQSGEQNEYGDEAQFSSSTTTTEAPKKVGPVVRPFRSNDDLLNSLKRRRQDAKKHRSEQKSEKPKQKSKHSSKEEDSNESVEQAAPAAPAPKRLAKPSLPGTNRRFALKSAKTVPEQPSEDVAAAESEQQQQQHDQPKTRRAYGAGRSNLRRRV